MKNYRLMLALAVVVFLGVPASQTLAQTQNVPPGSVTESERNANRSGISEADTGTFEASTDTGTIGRTVEDVRKMQQELRGTERRQRRSNMNIENLNRRRNQRNRRSSQRNPPPPVHVQFQPSFSLQSVPAQQVANRVEINLTRLLQQRDAGAVQVSVSDRTATLTGSVESDYQRKLLEKMVRIEPGVSAVENLITVEEQIQFPAQ